MIRDEKLKCDTKRETVKITALFSGKFDKYEYIKGEEILPSAPSQIMQQDTCTYSALEKAFTKQT